MTVVPWPPPTPPNGRANATLQLDNHPSDHNRIADALDTLIARATPLAHVERANASSFAVSATSFAAATVMLDSGVITYDGGPIMVEFFAPFVTMGLSNSQTLYIGLGDGATDLGYFGFLQSNAVNVGYNAPMNLRRRLTPTAGPHQYTIRPWITAGASGVVWGGLGGAGNPVPAFLRIVRA